MRRLFLTAALLAACGTAVGAQCAADRVDLRGDWGTARFDVELATTPEERSRGLMFRESMPRGDGMLFVFDRERPLSFWMRNTLIALDIIFLDAEGRVVNVAAGAVPGDETPLPSDGPALAVLEVNAGLAARMGIGPGDELRSPVLPQDDAAWACGGE